MEGFQYDSEKIVLPKTNNMSIRIVMMLALMSGWIANILDVKGAFFHSGFDEGEKTIYMEVLEAF